MMIQRRQSLADTALIMSVPKVIPGEASLENQEKRKRTRRYATSATLKAFLLADH